MANFAAQLKDKFLGLVSRVAGCGGGRGAGVDKDIPKESSKMPNVQGVKIKPRDPNVPKGSQPGVN